MSNSAEFSVGANIKLFPSREDDFLGISYGVFKYIANPAYSTSSENILWGVQAVFSF